MIKPIDPGHGGVFNFVHCLPWDLVVNELELSGKTYLTSRANDSYITDKVKAKLIAADNVPSKKIKVVTERGTVYLLGRVTKAEAEAAVNIAKSVRGIVHIVKVFEYK